MSNNLLSIVHPKPASARFRKLNPRRIATLRVPYENGSWVISINGTMAIRSNTMEMSITKLSLLLSIIVRRAGSLSPSVIPRLDM